MLSKGVKSSVLLWFRIPQRPSKQGSTIKIQVEIVNLKRQTKHSETYRMAFFFLFLTFRFSSAVYFTTPKFNSVFFSSTDKLCCTMYGFQPYSSPVPQKSNLFLSTLTLPLSSMHQAPDVGKVKSAIHWINHYPMDTAISFWYTYPLDSDSSGPGCSNVG